MNARLRRGGFLALAFLLLGRAAAAPPTASHLFPAGGQRGTTVTVTCTGTFSWPVRVSAPGITVIPAKQPGKLEVTIPKDLAADRVWVRLYNDDGAAAPLPFLIGGLPEVAEKEPNDHPRDAQATADPNVTVNGVLAGGDVDGFAVRLAAGQTVVAAVDGNTRLGSPMDAVLQVASGAGTVLAENHDDLGLDPRLAFTAPQAGTYVVRVFAFPAAPDSSIRFAGGANYVYRLTLTTGPYITHAVPLSASRAAPGPVEVHGWNVPPGTRLPVVPLAPVEHGEREASGDADLGIAFAPKFAGAARVRLTPAAANSNAAPTLRPPATATGWLRRPRQTDDYLLPLARGQQVVITVESRSLDFALDPVVKLADPGGAAVATVEDPGSIRDAVITHTAAKEGTYRLSVSDRFREGGDRCVYRVTVLPAVPDFDLAVAADAFVVAPGKPTDVAIKVQRRGSVGPIKVEAVGLPPGVTAAPVVSESTGPTASAVTLKLSTTGASHSGPIRILGTASQPTDLRRHARTPPRLGATFDTVWLTAVGKK